MKRLRAHLKLALGSMLFCPCGIHKLFTIQHIVVLKMHVCCKTALFRSSWSTIGKQAILALGAEKNSLIGPGLGVFGKFEKILKHFRNFTPPGPLRCGSAWNRWIKNFKRYTCDRQLRLGVRRIGLKIGS